MRSFLRKAIALFRAMRVALHIGYGLTLALIYPWFSLAIRRRILQSWSAGLLHICNVHIDIAEDDPLHSLRHGLIVTNHISWLDVFVLNAVVPMRFVAKSEVRRWPLIGWLCARAQTLFIERGKARSAARINLHLVELLHQGECLAVFPEGTTTDGTSVAHFHSSLLQPAIDAEAKVHPIAIRYQDDSGGLSMVAAYIDEMSFGASMWNILSTTRLHVRLDVTTPLDAGAMDRRDLTRAAQLQISTALESMQCYPAIAQQTAGNLHTQAAESALFQSEQHFQSLYSVLLHPNLVEETGTTQTK